MRLTTAGESHGPGLVCVIEDIPAGLSVQRQSIDHELMRRQQGHGRGGRMKIESDEAKVIGGIRHGRTLGGPIALMVENRDYRNWEERMNPWPIESDVREEHLPRPGHADLAGLQKYGFSDVRNVLERASARETAARVAGGAVAKVFLKCLGVEIRSHVTRIGSVQVPQIEGGRRQLKLEEFENVDESPVRCLNTETEAKMVAEIDTLRKQNESLGGLFEVWAFGIVPGLGTHAYWQDRLDGKIAGAMLSIQSIKGCEIGDGFDLGARPGSKAHDEIFYSEERGYYRESNHAGGIEGGMTNGEAITVACAQKPLPTLTKPLRSVDITTKEPAPALKERTDSCTVPAAAVIAEAMLAIVLAEAYRKKFGGDHIDDVVASIQSYKQRIGWRH